MLNLKNLVDSQGHLRKSHHVIKVQDLIFSSYFCKTFQY